VWQHQRQIYYLVSQPHLQHWNLWSFKYIYIYIHTYIRSILWNLWWISIPSLFYCSPGEVIYEIPTKQSQCFVVVVQLCLHYLKNKASPKWRDMMPK
jgi:hypothetical protein